MELRRATYEYLQYAVPALVPISDSNAGIPSPLSSPLRLFTTLMTPLAASGPMLFPPGDQPEYINIHTTHCPHLFFKSGDYP